MTELTELIRAKSSPKMDGVRDSVEFVSFFPDFIWTVQDFTLELKLNGDPITEDEYLENALKLIKGIRKWLGWWIGPQEGQSYETLPIISVTASVFETRSRLIEMVPGN